MADTESDVLMLRGSVTVDGALKEYGISKSRLYAWMKSGKIRYVRNGDRRLVPRTELDRVLMEGMKNYPPTQGQVT